MLRITNEPAWLLHHRPYRDSSTILDILSEEHGRLALVARGSRRAKSRLAGILRPFLPLQLSWVARSDLGTLTGAEIFGRPVSLTGEALLAGYYVNELLIYLLHRHDPQPEIFRAYAATVARLQAEPGLQAVLREFELELLRLLGYALQLDHDAATGEALEPAARYDYRPGQGPAQVGERRGPMIFSGTELIAVRNREFTDPDVVRVAGRLLRHVLAFHLGGKELKSRKVLQEMRRSLAAGKGTDGSGIKEQD